MRDTVKIGNVLTEEIMSVIGNEKISFEQKGQIICGVLFPEKFTPTDTLSEVLTLSLRKDYVSLTLFCANSKKKQIERLKKFYMKKGKKPPEWFAQYYTNITQTLANISETFAIDNTSTNTKYNTNTKTKNRISNIDSTPLNPPGGLEGEDDDELFPPSVLDDQELALREAKDDADAEDDAADEIAAEIEETYRYKVNGAKLRKSLKSVLKKNSAAEVLEGYRKWLAVWKEDDFRWAPSRITDWIYDGKFAEEPRRGNARSAPTFDPDTHCNEPFLPDPI